MIVLIFVVLLIILAVLERVIYKKKDKSWDKTRLFIGVLMLILLFLISYFVTDTAMGVFYVFTGMGIFILTGVVNFRSDIEWLKYLSNIVGLPLMVYLWMKMFQNTLINPQYLLLLIITINMILCYSYKRKGTRKENITFAIGVVIVILLIYSYYKLPEFEDRIMLKQESVAQKYLEEELDVQGLYIYLDSFSGSLRGKEAIVKANNPLSGNVILMKYRNNKIVGYEIKDY